MTKKKGIILKVPYVWIEPEKLKSQSIDDITLEVYGSFPCEWNGGRSFIEYDGSIINGGELYKQYSKGEPLAKLNEKGRTVVISAVSKFNDKGVPFFLTMTNPKMKSKDNTKRIFSFLDLLAAKQGLNGVIVANDDIYSALKRRYGDNLQFICSVIRTLMDRSFSVEEALVKYDAVVLNPENVKEGRYDNLSSEYKAKAILLANHYCKPGCPNSNGHYIRCADSERAEIRHSNSLRVGSHCGGYEKYLLESNDIMRLREIGFEHFKLGRTNPSGDRIIEQFPQLRKIKQEYIDF